MGEPEAAFAAPEAAHRGEHAGLRIPGGVDDDRARFGVAVALVEAADAHRAAIMARIEFGGPIGAVGAGLGARLVGETLQEAGMLGIGAAAVRDQMAGDSAAI